MKESPRPTFIDLFAGIGGFHEAFKGLGAECKFVCERDEAARTTYQAFHGESWGDEFLVNGPGINHPPSFIRDITDLTLSSSDKRGNKGTRKIRKVMAGFNVDILCGGFPCQPFSQAGKRKGFEDETRGTLFYDICRIIRAKKPRAFFLENVRGILTSGGVVLDPEGAALPYGSTLKTILHKLFSPVPAGGLGYHPPGGRNTKKRRKLEAEHGVRPHLLVSAPNGKEVMWVRPDPLILGKEFAEEGGGAVSHPDGQPGGAGSMFIPQLAC